MRLKLRHETTYAYATPARGAIQVLRLTPRNTDTQFVRRWRVEIDADCRLDRDEDAYGNICHTFSIDGPIESLRVLVDGEIDVESNVGIISGTLERFPASFWASQTRLTEPDAAILEFAGDLASQEGGDRLAFLHRLVAAIYADFAFDLDETHAATTAIEAFAARKGVCQDFAHVFVAAARARGIPARYVSGYFFRSDTQEQEAGHAWAEAYLPGLGWVGFDPANGVSADERFIRIAVGRDYLEAAPIRGSRLGGIGEAMTVSVSLSSGRALVEQ